MCISSLFVVTISRLHMFFDASPFHCIILIFMVQVIIYMLPYLRKSHQTPWSFTCTSWPLIRPEDDFLSLLSLPLLLFLPLSGWPWVSTILCFLSMSPRNHTTIVYQTHSPPILLSYISTWANITAYAPILSGYALLMSPCRHWLVFVLTLYHKNTMDLMPLRSNSSIVLVPIRPNRFVLLLT